MSVSYPQSWRSLTLPNVRYELVDALEELSNASRTAAWRSPDPNGPVVGIESIVHFFFDDLDWGDHSIGQSLFDADELAAVQAVASKLEAILATTPGAAKQFWRGSISDQNAYFIDHPLWPGVQRAAEAASSLLSVKGSATRADES